MTRPPVLHVSSVGGRTPSPGVLVRLLGLNAVHLSFPRFVHVSSTSLSLLSPSLLSPPLSFSPSLFSSILLYSHLSSLLIFALLSALSLSIFILSPPLFYSPSQLNSIFHFLSPLISLPSILSFLVSPNLSSPSCLLSLLDLLPYLLLPRPSSVAKFN